MTELVFLQDLAIVMAVSAVIMIFCQRFGLPVVLGYIIAGVVIGPHTPPFPLIHDIHNIHTLSELGVIFLLFSIGLEFSLTKLMRVGLVSVFAATLEIILMIWIGYTVGRLFGWKFMDSLFLGAILSISSTTIIAKVLMEMKRIKEKFAQVILGILIVEDLLAIVIIALLSGVASTGSLEMAEVGTAMIRVSAFIGGVLFLGFLIVPRLLKYVIKFENPEMLVITLLGLCFGVSILAARFGFSVALGAFLIGAVIAETKQVEKIIHRIEPIRDMFTAIFFVSVGMLLSPQIVIQYWHFILMITLVTLIGKIISCSLGAFLMGYSSDTALKVGLGLAQIGEFSFIIARLGESTEVTSPFLYPIAVSVSCITTLTTPFLMRNTGFIIKGIKSLFPKPLATSLSLYTGWFERIGKGRSERKAMVGTGLKVYLPRLFLYAFGALILFYGASRLQAHFLFPTTPYWAVLGLVMFPLFLGFIYTLDRILWNVLFLNLIRSRQEIEKSKDVYQFLHNALRFFMVIAAGLVFLAVGSRFLPQLPLALAFLGLLFIGGIFLWSSMRRMHEKIEKTVMGIFDHDKPAAQNQVSAQAHDELVKLIQQEYPWEVMTEDFLLPYRETGVNRPIRDLRLRSETGATIVAIYRDQEFIPNPAPETRLMPGDVVLLMGDQSQMLAAIQFLSQKMKEPAVLAAKKEGQPKTQPFPIPSNSIFIGRTLREIRLRRKTGVTVLGLQKSNLAINNPDPDTLIEEGDVLILFAWPEELEAAIAYLSRDSDKT